MAILRYWKNARLTGFLANARRQQIVNGMITQLFGILAGSDWGRAENLFVSGNDRKKGFDRLLSLFANEMSGFVTILRRSAADVRGERQQIMEWYAALAARYGVCSDRLLCDFAIEIASRPQDVPIRYLREELLAHLTSIMAKPILLRGARIVALKHACPDDLTLELLPSWE